MLRVSPIRFCVSIIALFAFTMNGDLLHSQQVSNNRPALPHDESIKLLEEKIKKSLDLLSQAEGMKNDILKMVMDWRTSDDKPLLLTLKQKHDAVISKDVGDSSIKSDQFDVERTIIKELCEGLRSNVSCEYEVSSFKDIAENKSANLFDYTVLFKILGDAIGLNAAVVEYINGPFTDLDCFYPHLCCMVFLDSEIVVLVSLKDYSVGQPFTLSEHYEKSGSCWRKKEREKDHRGAFVFLDMICISKYMSFENAVSLLSESPDIPNSQADLAIKEGGKELNEFIESCPNSTLGYFTKAAIGFLAKEPERALEILDEVLRIYPDCDLVFFKRQTFIGK